MIPNVEDCALMQWLMSHAPAYVAKVRELRDEVTGWLGYIPQTFPHYTRHTVDHSNEIVLQVSNMLFVGGNPEQLALPDLSAVEAYIVVAAAYLHDSGMVVSDREKTAILDSKAWKKWISLPEQNRRIAEIEELRKGDDLPNGATRHFLADRQLRFLIAEFVRREHHYRAVDIIQVHQQNLGRFAFDDPQLASSISNVCVGHGLSRHALEDIDRYPEEVDLQGEKANVRMCAVLLRLGDLLDLRTARACPLLLNAACPLPVDSTSHWSQYSSILKRNTAPDQIQITAECRTPDEHRKLRDWCKWIEDEATNAARLMRNARRHSEWKPPVARIGTRTDQSATIRIGPAPNAKYKDVDWAFKLDENVVFERLIRDTYTSEWDFIRELLQNALDATRCKMSMDLVFQGHAAPEDPRDVEPAIRTKYPINVSLESTPVINEQTGQEEVRTVVVVATRGNGIDADVVRHYLLQIGQSWYDSRRFHDSFNFVASSKFGIGFLSTFAVSSHIEIETLKAGHGEVPLRLVLTGPRNYILVETGNRSAAGTRVAVQTSKAPPTPLLEMLRTWCRRVEFPIVVREGGEEFDVNDVCAAPIVDEASDSTDSWVVHTFALDDRRICGELFVMAHRTDGIETWGTTSYDAKERREAQPTNVLPLLPGKLICFGGISVVEDEYPIIASDSYAIDCRRRGMSPVLSRRSLHSSTRDEIEASVNHRWEEILNQHLSEHERLDDQEHLWKYKQYLASQFRLPTYWADIDGMIPLYTHKNCSYVSFRQASQLPELWLMSTTTKYEYKIPREFGEDFDEPRLFIQDAHSLCEEHQGLFKGRGIAAVTQGEDHQVAVKLASGLCTALPAERVSGGKLVHGVHAVALPEGMPFVIGVTSTTEFYQLIVLNESHPLGSWCARMVHRKWSWADPRRSSQFSAY